MKYVAGGKVFSGYLAFNLNIGFSCVTAHGSANRFYRYCYYICP